MEDEKDLQLQGQEQNTEPQTDGEEKNNDKESPEYRGKVLMQRALDHLEKGEMEEFETDRKLANKMFDQMQAEEEEIDALYNESRNFGIIYNIIESNTQKLLESANGKKSLRRIVKAIKEDKILHNQFKAYNNLMPSNKIVNASEYITEALSLSPTFNKKAVKESNEKLIKLIRKEGLDEMIHIDDDRLNLYESIEYVTMNKKSLNNIDKFIDATNVIKESIEKLPVLNENIATIETYAQEVENLSENIAKDLTTDELQLIKKVVDNGEPYFNECKEKTLNKLNKLMLSESDMENKSRLSVIFEKIDKKSYNKKNAIVDIAEMIEIQSTIDD